MEKWWHNIKKIKYSYFELMAKDSNARREKTRKMKICEIK